MGPRVYPSFQDTNTTAKGSLILSNNALLITNIDVTINGVLKSRIWNNQVNGYYFWNLNIGDVVVITTIGASINFTLNRKDYTTDEQGNDNGIRTTSIYEYYSLTSYTFTATTIESSYNFEYLITSSIAGTPTPTPTPTPLPNIGNLTVNLFYSFSGDTGGLRKRLRANASGTGVSFWNTGYIGWYGATITGNTTLAADTISGTTYFTSVNLSSPIFTTIDLTSDYNYEQFYSTTNTSLNISVNGVPSYTVYNAKDNFVYSDNTIPNVREILSTSNIVLNNNDVLDIYVYSDLRLLPNLPQTIPTGSLFYYDPGNIASYPGSGSILYDISGNNRHANINSGITWVSGSNAYFKFTGNTNQQITGVTLNQTLTGWTMWSAVERNEVGSDWSSIRCDYLTGSNRIGQNGATNSAIGTQGSYGVNYASQESPGNIETGYWMFLGAGQEPLEPTNPFSTTCQWTLGSVKYGSSYFNDIQDAYVDSGSYFNAPIFIGPESINGKVGPTLMYNRVLRGEELNAINLYFKNRYIDIPPTPTPTPTPLPTATPTPSPTPYPQSGITAGAIIYVNGTSPSYPGTGTTWNSIITGFTFNGTLTNGPVWSGGTPSYFTFDGTNDWVDFGAASSGSTTGSYSFGGWFKSTTSATEKVIYMRGNDASGSGWSLLISKNSSDVLVAGAVLTTTSTVTMTTNSTTTLVDNTWYYVMATFKPRVGTILSALRIYVNGQLQGSSFAAQTNLRTSGIGWTIARGNGNYSSCDVAEFQQYQNELTAAQILNNFNGTKTKYGY